jgi:hypothetical protein
MPNFFNQQIRGGVSLRKDLLEKASYFWALGGILDYVE